MNPNPLLPDALRGSTLARLCYVKDVALSPSELDGDARRIAKLLWVALQLDMKPGLLTLSDYIDAQPWECARAADVLRALAGAREYALRQDVQERMELPAGWHFGGKQDLGGRAQKFSAIPREFGLTRLVTSNWQGQHTTVKQEKP